MEEPKGTEVAERDHLFLSYATKDGGFADWLALKLTSEGYNVWYDRLKMLGGESYPKDITEAIKRAHKLYTTLRELSYFEHLNDSIFAFI